MARRARRSGRRSAPSSASSQPPTTSTSVSTKATSGVVTSARPALRAAAGPRFVSRRIEPLTGCGGERRFAGVVDHDHCVGVDPASCGRASKAGTTTVTSAAVNGDSVGSGWIAPASTSRWVNLAWPGGSGCCCSIASTTLRPFGRQTEQAQRRAGHDDQIVPAVAAVEPKVADVHARHSSTAATRSMISRVSSALPCPTVAGRGSPSTPFGLTARTPSARS